MATLRNVNPCGAVDLPLLGRVVEAGEEFDIADDLAAGLLEQVGNYESVSVPATKTTAKRAATSTDTQEG